MEPLLKSGYDKNTALLFIRLSHIHAELCALTEIEESPLPGDEWKGNDDK